MLDVIKDEFGNMIGDKIRYWLTLSDYQNDDGKEPEQQWDIRHDCRSPTGCVVEAVVIDNLRVYRRNHHDTKSGAIILKISEKPSLPRYVLMAWPTPLVHFQINPIFHKHDSLFLQ